MKVTHLPFGSDVEKPHVWRCPLSFEVHLSPGEQSRPVSWVEPHFTDNVGVEALFRTKVRYSCECNYYMYTNES